MALGGMIGGLVGGLASKVGGAMAKRGMAKKPTDDGTSLAKAQPGSKAGAMMGARKRKLGIGRSMLSR